MKLYMQYTLQVALAKQQCSSIQLLKPNFYEFLNDLYCQLLERLECCDTKLSWFCFCKTTTSKFTICLQYNYG